ncbi:hypothetical protein G6F24_018982 [Rhizopus arrhizus]|nr:hypothetical protein G6F24_018982 [Rhizopus arrhizus]
MRTQASVHTLPICSRCSALMPGAGASSTTFWWRRCIEQSRSPRWMALPWPSESTWTSTWRGFSRNFSM